MSWHEGVLQIGLHNEERAHETCRQKTQIQPIKCSKQPTHMEEVIGVDFIGCVARYCVLSHYITRHSAVYSTAVCHLV